MIQNFKTGLIKDIPDTRDYQYRDVVGHAPFNWIEGYDIEEELGFKLPVKDQGNSASCGAQAFATYSSVLEFFASGTFEERSAKFLYSQAFLPNGGSRFADIARILKKQGCAREVFFPSRDKKGDPIKEEVYREASKLITPAIRNDAKSSQALDYYYVDTNIDLVAQAIANNKGCLLGLIGENNGTWYTEFPKIPKKHEWQHGVYAGKARIINGKKFIGFFNSYGKLCGKNGWQWIGEDYFNITFAYDAVFNCITLINKEIDEKKNLLITLLLALIEKLDKK